LGGLDSWRIHRFFGIIYANMPTNRSPGWDSLHPRLPNNKLVPLVRPNYGFFTPMPFRPGWFAPCLFCSLAFLLPGSFTSWLVRL